MGKLAVVVLGLALSGCGGGGGGAKPTCETLGCPDGFECSAAAEKCEQASGVMNWTLTDSCMDGVDVHVVYFDITNGLRWPGDATLDYVVHDGTTMTAALACLPGATVCYGAEPNPPDGKYWGRSLSGGQACPACCSACGMSPSINLICN